MFSYSAVVVLAFLAALFLGDALRRLRSQIQDTSKLELAKKTMFLHTFVMLFHTIMFAFCTETLDLSLYFTNPAFAILWNVTKIMDFLAQSISQLIIMYLIKHFQRPLLLKIINKEEEGDSDDESSSMSYDSNYIQALMYIKKKQ